MNRRLTPVSLACLALSADLVAIEQRGKPVALTRTGKVVIHRTSIATARLASTSQVLEMIQPKLRPLPDRQLNTGY